MKIIIPVLLIFCSFNALARTLVEKKVDELLEDRDRIETFVGREETSRSACRFFYQNFNERKAKTIADTLNSKKKIKDAYKFEEVLDLPVEHCETLAKEYAYD